MSSVSPVREPALLQADAASTDARAHFKGCCCCKRLSKWQCCALLTVICTVVIAVLGLAGVLGNRIMGPRLAKSELERSRVSFTLLDMIEPIEGGFSVGAGVRIGNVAPFSGEIGVADLDVLYADQVFGRMQMPALAVEAGKDSHRSISARPFLITNLAVWNEFSHAMVHNKTVNWQLKGNVTLSTTILGMTLRFDTVPFNKIIPLDCFNGMDDAQMSVFDLSQSTKDNLIVNMIVCLKNPSAIAIEDLGDLFFGVYYKGAYMGNVTARRAAMPVINSDGSDELCTKFSDKGYNAISMAGRLKPADRTIANDLISRYFGGLSSTVTARALSPVASSLPLLNTAMQGLEISTKLNGQDQALITGVDFKHVMIAPISNHELSMNMTSQVSMVNPLGSKSGLEVHEVNLGVNLSYGTKELALIGTAYTGRVKVPAPNKVLGKANLTIPAAATMTLPDDGAALTTFAKDLVMRDRLELYLHGATDCLAKCDALGYDMNISGIPVILPNGVTKPPCGPVLVQGMGGLPGVQILEYKVPGNVPDGTDGCQTQCGMQMEITALVPNPAPFGLTIGTMNGQLEDAHGAILGTIGTDSLTLAPGNNTVTMSGKVKPADGQALEALGVFMSTYLRKDSQKTTVRGTDAGGSPVQWLQNVVNGIELSTTFPGANKDFQMLTDIRLASMNMSFSNSGTPMVGAIVQANLRVPPQLDISIIQDVKKAGMSFDLVNGGNVAGGMNLSRETPVRYENSAITVSFGLSPMTVNTSEMQSLIKDLLTQPSRVVQMRGTSSPQAESNAGTLQLVDVPFQGETTMYGFNNFVDARTQTPLMKIDKLDVVGGEAEYLHLTVDFEITNPSNLAPSMGQVTMELWTASGFKIGDVTVEDFTLRANADKNCTTKFTSVPARYIPPTAPPEAVRAARDFLSTFVSHGAQESEVRGTAAGSSIALLQPALAAFRTSSHVPGLAEKICIKSVMHIPSVFRIYDVPVDLTAYNPFGTFMKITGVKTEIFGCEEFDSATVCKKFYNESVGVYTPDRLNVVVAPRMQVTLPTHNVQLHKMLSTEVIAMMTRSGEKGSLIYISGTMDIEVGDFQMQVDFSERDIPICLDYLWHSCKHFLESSAAFV